MYFDQLPDALSASFAGRVKNWGPEQAAVLRMQNEVPAGERMLVYMSTPALLDFRRNRIDVIDWPGEASPPPGMPVRAGGEKIAEYLLGQKIRYLAYSYRLEAGFPPQQYVVYVSPVLGRIISRQAADSFAFQDALSELMQTRRRIYDDGSNVLLDLSQGK